MQLATSTVDQADSGSRCAPWSWTALVIATLVIAVAAFTGFYCRSGENNTARIGELTSDLEQARLGYKESHRHANQAREQAAAARAELAEVVTDYFSVDRDADEVRPQVQSAKSPAAQPVPNREHQELAERYRALMSRRNELLLRLTSAHPAVEDVELQLADLKERLEDTPEFIASSKDAPAATRQIEEQLSQQRIEHRAAAKMIAETVAKVRQLDDAATASSAAELAAIDAHLAAAARLSAGLNDRDPRPPWLGPEVWLRLVFAGGMLLVIGGAWSIVRQHWASKLRTAHDIESTLTLPLVAVVPGMAASGKSRHAVTASALVGKTTLAVVVFALVACLVQDPAMVMQWLRGG